MLEADDNPITVVQTGCHFALLADKWNKHGKKTPCLKPCLFLLCFGRTAKKYEHEIGAISMTGLGLHIR